MVWNYYFILLINVARVHGVNMFISMCYYLALNKRKGMLHYIFAGGFIFFL